MSHTYYEEDFDSGSESRLKYFDTWFKSNSKFLAKEREQTISKFLSDMKDFSSFKDKIKEVFSIDTSLSHYVEGMSERGLKIFYNRDVIQDIIEANQEEDEEEKEEFFEELEDTTPVAVEQVHKEVEEFFRGTFVEKETGKTKKVIAKKEIVKVQGKDQIRFRDSKGRFVSKT